MNQYFQCTIAKRTRFTGVGLHSGRLVDMEIIPAEPNYGIRFLRTDIPDSQPIPAHPDFVVSTNLSTTIGNTALNKVSTIEHLMAAFYALGLDNLLIKISALEVPILDGSAAPFYDHLIEIGIQVQPIPKKVIHILKPLRVELPGQWMDYIPPARDQKTLTLTYEIAYPSQVIGTQKQSLTIGHLNFNSIAESRTFCHLKDVDYMRSQGLALGGSLDNAIVVSNEKIMNNEGLRSDKEFVQHKMLDCLGDLWLLGGYLFGSVHVYRGGHTLHTLFASEILKKYGNIHQKK